MTGIGNRTPASARQLRMPMERKQRRELAALIESNERRMAGAEITTLADCPEKRRVATQFVRQQERDSWFYQPRR